MPSPELMFMLVCLTHNFKHRWQCVLTFSHGAGIGFGDHCAYIYTAEMAPPKWRGRLNTLVQLGTISGIVVANAINIATDNLLWGWRLSLGLAAVPGLVLVLGKQYLHAKLLMLATAIPSHKLIGPSDDAKCITSVNSDNIRQDHLQYDHSVKIAIDATTSLTTTKVHQQ